MRRVYLLVLIIALSLTMSSQTKSTQSSKGSGKAKSAASSAFARLSDQFMKESLALSPVNASQAGYHVHGKGKAARHLDAELDDVGPAAFEKQAKFYRDWRKRFSTKIRYSDEDAADLRLIQDNIALNLLELERIQNYRHNPTVFVELIGNGLFLPLTQEYASKDVRIGHVLSRISKIPRVLNQAKQVLVDSDPIFVKVALEENEGNIDLIENTVKPEIPAGSPLMKRYEEVAPKAIAALKEFSTGLSDDLGKRKPTRDWRLGKEFYDVKFKHVMQATLSPEQLLADAESDLKTVRAEMLELASPMHKEMYPDHVDHSDLSGEERTNAIVSEVLKKVSDDHPRRDQLIEVVKGDLESIKQFIREKKIVALSPRENLKVIPTPVFMRGIYSVAGFHAAPPLEPKAEAQYWVTPIDPKTPDDRAESKLREYNNWVLKWLTIHEALPGHYIQFEHANDVQPETRRLLRALLGNGAYVEGWAEYIAQVMMDEGFANGDPRFKLSMRKIRLRLLANTILDIRMQTMNMTDQEAMDLMTKTAFQTQAEAEGKLQRAKLSSTQLPTYYVGLREWLKLRDKYQAAKGGQFDKMKFHNLVLDEGPIAFDSLEKLVMKDAGKAAGAQ
ncbi:MAG: DUF885 domain-containing protein [Acidobacteriales bacterium]|nr:DUF885 domain-containing protein [Terriglobales bacterium]